MAVDRERKIRERAFAIWVNEEMVDGRDREHWLEAEKQIDKEEADDENRSAAADSEKGTGAQLRGSKP